jgi:hypothetical protein
MPVLLAGDGYAANAAGTTAASSALAETGVACVITLGGDGTNRAVVAGWPDAVLVPLPGGTNNAFATPVDPTAAGYAAARYAGDPARHERHVVTRPRLEIRVGGRTIIALVDVAAVRGGWVGAHAIWDPDLLVEAIVARSDPAVPGLAGVAGSVFPLADGDGRAIRLRFGPGGRSVVVPLGPGQLVPVSVRDWRLFGPGETVVTPDPADGARGHITLAFDGERELVLGPGETADARLVLDGPRVLDAPALLRRAAVDGPLHDRA